MMGNEWGEFECEGKYCDCSCEDDCECDNDCNEYNCYCKPHETIWTYFDFLNYLFGLKQNIRSHIDLEDVDQFMNEFFLPKLMSLLKNNPLINLEELAREAFKPERLMYQLSFDPDYNE